MTDEAKITGAEVRVYRIPTDAPEADGTCSWDQTTMILVELASGATKGIGYTYGDEAVAAVAKSLLDSVVKGQDAWRHAAILSDMRGKVRNDGETGITAMAISAIDNALWDLRARLLNVPLVHLLGRVRECVPVYGSGGFTSYDDAQLTAQLGGWASSGFKMVKMKIGSHPADDARRVRMARKAIGDEVQLFVDANGAYSVMQALRLAEEFAGQDVRWFEEPVSSDNLTGLREVRQRIPVGMDVAAGEYGYSAWYQKRMLDAEAVTVLQADATRCCGISGFLDAAALCWAANVPLSSHCAPSMHVHVCCAVPRAVHMEFFHDHARIERMFFDGFCEPRDGCMAPDLTRPGHGLTLREKDAQKFRI
ncbi:MAG: enolase C-terminal domain-like protein [Acidobacteriota bacterium]